MLLPVFAPSPAQAYNFTQPPTVQNGTVCPGTGLTRRMLPCIKETVLYVTNQVLVPFSSFMAGTIALACTLAVVIWGVLMASGKATAPMRDALVMAMKIGGVIMFTTNFGSVFGMLLDAMDGMLGVVSGYVLVASSFSTHPNCIIPAGDSAVLRVWDAVDCTIEILVGGIFSPLTLSLGIVGFLVSCLFSGAAGFMIALAGFYLIIQLLMAIIQALFMFISSYIGFALMILISPLFVPLILFHVTKPYFTRWLRITLSFILQPMLIFAFLAMLLAAFDTVVYTGPNSLYRTLANDNNQSGCGTVDNPIPPGSSFNLGEWLRCAGAYAQGNLGAQAININPAQLAGSLGLPANSIYTGATGAIAQLSNPAMNQQGSTPMDIFNVLGIGAGGGQQRFFRTSVPVLGIDWWMLAMVNDYIDSSSGTPTPNVVAFLADLLLAFGMALLTAYIFTSMVKFLPFIGSGIAGGQIESGKAPGGGIGLPGVLGGGG